MGRICKASRDFFPGILAIILSVTVSLPAGAYDYPLTSSAIRDAYFLGVRQGGLSPEFLSRYSRAVPDLREGNCTSEIRLETPFLQIVEYIGGVPNYSAQDAVKEFYAKPMKFRVFLNICYMRGAPPPNSVKIRILQNRKVIAPDSDIRSAYAEPISDISVLPPNGEKVQLEFDGKKIDSSTLSIRIDTPDDQHSETEFPLQSLR